MAPAQKHHYTEAGSINYGCRFVLINFQNKRVYGAQTGGGKRHRWYWWFYPNKNTKCGARLALHFASSFSSPHFPVPMHPVWSGVVFCAERRNYDKIQRLAWRAGERLCESLELCFFFLYHSATRHQSMGRKETARHIDLPYRGAVFAPALQMIEEPANAVINQLQLIMLGM